MTKAARIIPFVVSLSFFMEAMDSTIINTAIPAISRSLSVSPVELKIALISYLLSLAIFIPISGWLADKFGAKRIFMTALVIFTVSSVACGMAEHLAFLVIARLIQGFGGALGLPVGRLILIRTVGREHFIASMNHVVMVGAIGMMLGPVVGGFITHYFSWQWIFWVNIPFGLLAIFLSMRYLPTTKPLPVPPLDKPGFVLFGASLAGFTFGLSALTEEMLGLQSALAFLMVSLALLVCYALHSRGQKHPIVKTELLRLRTFRISVMGNLAARLGFGGMPFLIPLLLQIDLGLPAQVAGLLLAPIALGIVLGKPLTLGLLRMFGYRKFLILNTLSAGIALGMFTTIDKETSFYAIGALNALYGFILTLQYGAMNSLAYADLPPDDLSSANSIMSTVQQLSQSFGVAVSALLLHVFSSFFYAKLTLSTPIFHDTFLALGALTCLSVFIFMQLKPEDGRQMTHV